MSSNGDVAAAAFRTSAPVVEVGCKGHKKRCGGKSARNRVGINQRNEANVDSRSGAGSRNEVYIDQRNQADVETYGSQNDVWIQQYNKANVHIR